MSRRATPNRPASGRGPTLRAARRAAIVALAMTLPAVLSACGGATMYAPAPDVSTDAATDAIDDVAALGQTAEQMEDDLDHALENRATEEALPAESCEDACTISLNICDLSDRICRIADDFPENGVLAGRCIDAQVRCKRGARDTALACDCSEVELRFRI